MAVRVGDDVIARDKKCIWYAAKVTAERGEGRHRQLKVHFLGWKARFDEWRNDRAAVADEVTEHEARHVPAVDRVDHVANLHRQCDGGVTAG